MLKKKKEAFIPKFWACLSAKDCGTGLEEVPIQEWVIDFIKEQTKKEK